MDSRTNRQFAIQPTGTRIDLSRREFLGKASGLAAGCLAAHDWLGNRPLSRTNPNDQTTHVEADNKDPLIKHIQLLTMAPIATMKEFYESRLGLKVLAESDSVLTLEAGQSQITFRAARPEQLTTDGGRGNGEPFYHFAFNIPENKIMAARNWQLERTSLVPSPPNLRDQEFPEDIRHFKNWNAHSVFFFDPAFNILEYIARHDLRNAASDADRFSSSDIICVSEIGFVCEAASRDRIAKTIHADLGLEAFPAGTDDWWAMGDNNGLLLCLGRKGEVWGDNTETPVTWDVWETQVSVRGNKSGELQLGELPYRINVES